MAHTQYSSRANKAIDPKDELSATNTVEVYQAEEDEDTTKGEKPAVGAKVKEGAGDRKSVV